MTNFIPIFPLGIVVYPGEDLNLHIFEPRYKQLIKECHEQKKGFGIPTVIENKLQENGTLVQITELTKLYDNGEMDIQGFEEKAVKGGRELIKKFKLSSTPGYFLLVDIDLIGGGRKTRKSKVFLGVCQNS